MVDVPDREPTSIERRIGVCIAGLVILGIVLFIAGTIVPRLWDAITVSNALELIKALAPAATALIAFQALRNWQRQDKAKREAEFLDELIEAAHAYISEINKPLSIVHMAKIGMESHAQTWERGDPTEIAVKGAVAYIEKYGKEESDRLFQALNAIKPSVVRLRSLAGKGQIFRFYGYAKCLNAVTMLAWHFDKMEAFASLIGSPTLNWQHPMVLKNLKDYMAVDPDWISAKVEEDTVALLAFTRETYGRIYGIK